MSILRPFQIKDGWLEDGSWACVVEIPAGMKGEIIGQIMKVSSQSEVKKCNALIPFKGLSLSWVGQSPERRERNVPRSKRRRAAPSDPGNGYWAIDRDACRKWRNKPQRRNYCNQTWLG